MRVGMAFSRILLLLDCNKINMGANFEIPHFKNLDLRVKMRFTPKKLFLDETDFTSTYLKVRPKSKHFSAMIACSG